MNLTNYLYQGKLFVVDAGVLFPDPSKLGIGSIVPDVSKFFAKSGGVFAYVITHGHEDHIGALPFLYEQYPGFRHYQQRTQEFLLKNILSRGPVKTI